MRNMSRPKTPYVPLNVRRLRFWMIEQDLRSIRALYRYVADKYPDAKFSHTHLTRVIKSGECHPLTLVRLEHVTGLELRLQPKVGKE